MLIVGAGETAELTAEALHARGVATLFVANRRRERAETLAHRFDGATLSFDELPTALLRADIVVASTSSPHALIEAEVLAEVIEAREGRPLLLIDLAVPRDIEPACGGLPGVTLANVDDLQRGGRAPHAASAAAEAARAEAIVEEEIADFAGWLGSLEVMPTIAALRRHADAIVAGVLEENEARWEALSERDRERVEAVARDRRPAAAARADAARQAGRRRRAPRAHARAARAVRARVDDDRDAAPTSEPVRAR